MERQEKQLEADIKKAAREGNKAVCAILAKQLVNLRKQKTRFYVANSQIGAVNNQAKAIHASSKMAGAMSSTAKTLKSVNEAVNPGKVMESLRDFERENAKMDMKSEIMDDTLESVLNESGDEAEEDAIIDQVLDEIGIDIKGKVSDLLLIGNLILYTYHDIYRFFSWLKPDQ